MASGAQDEVYDYDGLHQLKQLQRGTLSGGQIGDVVWQEDFLFDPTGNWHDSSEDGRGYVTAEIVEGNLDETLVQNRAHNQAKEITDITETTGPAWVTPGHDAAGNMTTIPRPASPTNSYICLYDAWNRLVKVKLDASTVLAEYAYDGLMRRIKKSTDDEVRHYYYSDQWQVIEERVEVENEEIELVLNRQWVWGIRRLDDVVLRDRDTDADGELDERLYGLSDALNLTAVVNTSGTVVERYGYNAFGASRVMAADWSARSSSDYDWEVRFGGYRWDGETGLYQVRFRYLHPGLGRWTQRDVLDLFFSVPPFLYVQNDPPVLFDPHGLQAYPSYLIHKNAPPALVLTLPGSEPRLGPSISQPLTNPPVLASPPGGPEHAPVPQQHDGGANLMTFLLTSPDPAKRPPPIAPSRPPDIPLGPQVPPTENAQRDKCRVPVLVPPKEPMRPTFQPSPAAQGVAGIPYVANQALDTFILLWSIKAMQTGKSNATMQTTPGATSFWFIHIHQGTVLTNDLRSFGQQYLIERSDEQYWTPITIRRALPE